MCDLVDVVSKNGCLLLNIGPRSDGTIPNEDQQILLAIGEWLKINGEAIYGTNVWRKYGEGDTIVVEGQFSDNIKKNFTSKDFRFTTANGYLYAIALKCSDDGKYCIKSLSVRDASRQAHFCGIIRSVTVLGCEEKAKWERTEEGLMLETTMTSDKPIVFKIEVE